MPAAVLSHSKAREELRGQGRNKKDKSKDGKPKLGAGNTAIKSQKEVSESELNQKLAENEERRRQWLMSWHIEVDQMQKDLWEMEQTLSKSLVRTESAKKRDRDRRMDVEKPEMTEEELDKLPVRMRPRPKYKPYMSHKERTDLNDQSFNKVLRRLHDHPRRFDAMTPDNFGSRSTPSRFPQVQVSAIETDRYKLLLLKNPFSKDIERNNMLMRSRTDFLQVPSSMRPGRPYFKQPTTNTTKSAADLGGDRLPALKIPSMPDLRQVGIKEAADGTLPKIGGGVMFNRENSNLSPVKEKSANVSASITRRTSISSPLKPVRGQTNLEKSAQKRGSIHRAPSPAESSTCSELSFGSEESGYMLAMKAKRQREKAKKAAAAAAENDPTMSSKNEPNLLNDANFRKTLIQQLDDKRQERSQDQGSKWGLVKKNVTSQLKVRMPDVIKAAILNKHKNRAVEQVQERIKARRNSVVPGQGLPGQGMSQSMNALDKISQFKK